MQNDRNFPLSIQTRLVSAKEVEKRGAEGLCDAVIGSLKNIGLDDTHMEKQRTPSRQTQVVILGFAHEWSSMLAILLSIFRVLVTGRTWLWKMLFDVFQS